MKRFLSMKTMFNGNLLHKHRIQYLIVFCAIVLSCFIFVNCNNSDETDTDYNPVAYGTIDDVGNILGGSDNFTVAKGTDGFYTITVTGFTCNYIDLHVEIELLAMNPGFTAWDTLAGNLRIFIYNSSGTMTNRYFCFSVWNN
jgi:hypothetical protein